MPTTQWTVNFTGYTNNPYVQRTETDYTIDFQRMYEEYIKYMNKLKQPEVTKLGNVLE